MTAYPTWTPATRPGIIPLQPLGFGTILGRSFAALRQNPKVLLGFALVVTAVSTILAAAGMVAIGLFAFSRLMSMRTFDEDYETVMAGAIALTSVGALVLSLATSAIGVLVQAVVVAEVSHSVVAEKLTLRRLWQRVKPVAWRIVGYTVMVAVAVFVVVAAIAGGFVALGIATGWWVVVPLVLLMLGAIPLALWLTVKLMLVPSVLVLEHATVFGAIARSWRLTRGRFWAALGVWIIIQLSFSLLTQVLGAPVSLLTSGLSSVLVPTGETPEAMIAALIGSSLLTQILVVVIQSVALVVVSTASALIYIDCRMRHEGLDLDLLAYVDARDAGGTDLPDPYRQHIGREIAPRPTPGAYPPPGSYPAGAYPAGPYPAGASPAPGAPPMQYAQPGMYPAPPAGAPPYATAPAVPPPAPPAPAPPAAPAPGAPSPTQWAAPGGAANGDD
ncbi:glycerophosphoryl diester phosphodiesterase membrane domain-containing protein [Microbacterium sp. bgisy189]|uniref:glycerophosphoryl diester phosphodiesterase membrane domain-containing protein n=1 Tax=Microbacterium sp. bgisy189 TaxID=3413798 RepID=UPI003EB71159